MTASAPEPGLRPVRVGVLGAASITRSALLTPARGVAGVDVVAIAARDPERARAYAGKHGIDRVHRTYDELLADPDLDAVYVPTPASHHATWTIAAIEAGKHVLCEKPFAANAEEAGLVHRAAAASDVVVMEAYHTAHHPNQDRLTEILARRTLGTLLEATARFCVPPAGRRNIRRNPALAGGVLLDVGYYPVRMLRDLLGEPEILTAVSSPRDEIDLHVGADLRFPEGVAGRVEAAMRWRNPLSAELQLIGDRGRLTMRMPFHPHQGVMRITVDGETSVERPDRRTSYSYQLERFREAIRRGADIRTDAEAAIPQMTMLDGLYRAAGLEPRRGVLA